MGAKESAETRRELPRHWGLVVVCGQGPLCYHAAAPLRGAHQHRRREGGEAHVQEAQAHRPAPARGDACRQAAARANVVWHQTAEEATLAHKPRFNGYACGHGAHGDAKYNRAKDKRAWRERGGQEGASRGSFPFLVAD